MYAPVSIANAVLCVVGILIFNGRVSEQFAVDGQSDQHVPQRQVILQTTAACEGSMGSSKCVQIKDKCFCYVNQQLSWLKAFEFCKTYRKNLICIESTSEQQEVVTILMPIILNDPIASKTGGIWTSGTSIPALETFYWASVQRIFAFANWNYGQPDITDSSPQCVRLVPSKEATWAISSCKNSYLPFICHD